jgi:hypothetical protein
MQQPTNNKFTTFFIGRKTFLFYFLFLIVTSAMSLQFTIIQFSFCKEAERATLYSLLNNSADVPFQYRMLVPWLVNVLYNLNLPFLDSPIRLFQVVEFIFTFLLIITYCSYVSLFIKNDMITYIISLVIFFILPFNFIFYTKINEALYYPSDIPSIFFFTLGLLLIFKKNWFLYYLAFIIATFNRETTIFLTFICLVTSIEKNKLFFGLLNCILQVFIWLLIKISLGILYAKNPGPGQFIIFLFINLAMFINPAKFSILTTNFGFTWIVPVLYFRLIKNDFVKRSLLVVFPFFLVMIMVGNLTELRIYGELIPVVVTAFLLIIRNLFELAFSEIRVNPEVT